MTGKIFAITTYHKPDRAALAAEEWRRLGICAIGWSPINLCLCQSKEEIRQKLKDNDYEVRGVEDIWNFTVHLPVFLSTEGRNTFFPSMITSPIIL